MATVYKIEIKTVSPFVAYSEKEMNKIMHDLVKSYSKLNFTFESTEVNTIKLDTADQYIHKSWIFAWLPTRTTNAGWVWLTPISKIVDERPKIYFGLKPQITYFNYEY